MWFDGLINFCTINKLETTHKKPGFFCNRLPTLPKHSFQDLFKTPSSNVELCAISNISWSLFAERLECSGNIRHIIEAIINFGKHKTLPQSALLAKQKPTKQKRSSGIKCVLCGKRRDVSV
eukprot:TRINITY_DN1202_c0_g4_i5.p2 TRINITY_DN1202_c0_g4~~TRINITY_DN1202_c0_g4_i5.p2  ORF type:complete len:121 (-),score=18.49 TRINITY_DN1202_c0_g4_i5:234-596(-)